MRCELKVIGVAAENEEEFELKRPIRKITTQLIRKPGNIKESWEQNM